MKDFFSKKNKKDCSTVNRKTMEQVQIKFHNYDNYSKFPCFFWSYFTIFPSWIRIQKRKPL